MAAFAANFGPVFFTEGLIMSDQFKIPVFRYRNATIVQGVPIFDPSKCKVKNNIGQGSFGEVYTVEFLGCGQHSNQRVLTENAITRLIRKKGSFSQRSSPPKCYELCKYGKDESGLLQTLCSDAIVHVF